MMAMLQVLENTDFAVWVRESAYGYGVLLTLHALGLALLAGILIVIDLRVLGFGRGLPMAPLKHLLRLVWIGFWSNAISGSMLFTSDAVKFYYSSNFRVKMSSIVIGVVLTLIIKSSVLSAAMSNDADAIAPPRAKLLASLSLVCWLTAIASGRLMAYLS